MGVDARRGRILITGLLAVACLVAAPGARADGVATGRLPGRAAYLTPSSGLPAGAVVRDYVRDHPSAIGMDDTEVSDLHVARSMPVRDGGEKLILRQEVDGVPILGGEVFASVSADGRLADLDAPAPTERPSPGQTASLEQTAPPASGEARIDETEALEAAGTAVGGEGATESPLFLDGDAAELVLNPGSEPMREDWRTLVEGAQGQAFEVLVDATTGEVIHRRDLARDAVLASVFDYYPGAPVGGEFIQRDITPYVTEPGASQLYGQNAYAYSDIHDEDPVQDIAPSSGDDYIFQFHAFNLPASNNCPPAPYYCSWNTAAAESWQGNLDRSTVQLFYQVNRFHDHLAAAPIEFTYANGGYEGRTAIFAAANVGADTNPLPKGLPYPEYLNNGFFSPNPGGHPNIVMYLFGPDNYSAFSSDDQLGEPTVNAADDGSFVFHEYTHGLSGALTSDATGVETLEGPQALAMSEGWSDWYAMDFVVEEGYETDTSTPGQIEWGRYTSEGPDTARHQALDCPVGAAAKYCPAAGSAGPGGFTYGDMGHIENYPGGIEAYPEAHADGTIWSQTLWDLRQRLIAAYGTQSGDETAEFLVTAAMEVSPPDPTFLDERNAILQADARYFAGEDDEIIWSVFAGRGMGYFASTTGPFDAHPTEDFSMPPSTAEPGSLSGTVTTQEGVPVAGATVEVGGFAHMLSAVTDAAGHYSIGGISAGRYPQVVVHSPLPGYADEIASDVEIDHGANSVRDVVLPRDWAALSDGAKLAAEVGPSTDGCPAASALDQNLDTGWGTYAPGNSAHPGPKSLTIQLAEPIVPSSVMVEPSAVGCYGEASATASLGGYSIEVSSDGTNFAPVSQGTFDGSDDGRRNVIPVSSTTPVSYVRLTADSTLSSAAGVGGSADMAITEFEVFGAPPAVPTPESPASSPPDTTPTPGPTAPITSPAPPPAHVLHCRKGFRKRKAKGKLRCVRVKKAHHHHHRGRRHRGPKADN
ncbi:MAG TPA: M36 family metallopeptidase [Solirubrobacterales bacterium]|nr:M36 family metallopeptidase [Solirubrobacterales bacterium]